ncbi:uncharacterized protein LOC129827645 isoform X2 [Salvelinus fontinalis]|uniref:uncharacterized protein LOC129827645 isoform X2 n=1 Tax=Salvelinus fontinalis TaxID=8038 RepID=UPI002486A5FD|nr:uncharacterized protein LOC129827645 isoform X2 [Salvelinus fontinalis]
MAGQGFQSAPKVMLLLCILGLTKEFELEDKDWDELRSDVAALHRLKGLPDQMTRRTTGADTREIIMHGTRTKRFSNYRAYVEKKPMALFDGLRGCDNFTTCVIQMDQKKAVTEPPTIKGPSSGVTGSSGSSSSSEVRIYGHGSRIWTTLLGRR